MNLGEQQRKFPPLVAALIQWIYTNPGYAVTFGETYRTPEQAALNAKNGSGISKSLHTQRLAIDLNLFINGAYIMNSESYAPLGAYWKSLDPDCCWGGDFTSHPDGNHFSLTFGGIK